MEFINETQFTAELFRNELEENFMYNSVLVRVRYQIESNNQLSLITSGDKALKDIRREPVEDEFGIIEADLFFPRTATDLIILGNAISTKGPVSQMSVNVSVGPYDETLIVTGDRIWEKRLMSKSLYPSPPELFESMPLKYDLAFGGSVVTPQGEHPYPSNPIGKGYYISKNEALGNPMPNIENPNDMLIEWKEPKKRKEQDFLNIQRDPVGFAPYPTNWALRLLKIIEWDQTLQGKLNVEDPELLAQQIESIDFNPDNGMFDRAHPRLSGKQIIPGQNLKLTGMSSKGTIIEFQIPEPSFELMVRLEDDVFTRDLELEEVFIDLRESIVDFSFRKLFDYEIIPYQIRQTTLKYKSE